MGIDEVTALVERGYAKIYGEGKGLFSHCSDSITCNPDGVMQLIRRLMEKDLPQIGYRPGATLCTLVVELASQYGDGEPSGLFVALMLCRLYSTLGGQTSTRDMPFLARRCAEHSLEVIKRWVSDGYEVLGTSNSWCPLRKKGVFQAVKLLFTRSGLLSEAHSIALAQIISQAALEERRIFFTLCNVHKLGAQQNLSPYAMNRDSGFGVEKGIFLSLQLPIEAQLLLATGRCSGSVLLFSCSLDIGGTRLQTFTNLLKSIQPDFVVSQRLLGPDLKEKLFDMGIVPLERLSLQFCGALQMVTGATPFHTEHEFRMWASSFIVQSKVTDNKLGAIQRVVLCSDQCMWVYGKDIVITVVLPGDDPVSQCTLMEVCERAARYASNSFVSSPEFKPSSVGVGEAFLAEYIYGRCMLFHNQNTHLACLVNTLRCALVSHALNINRSLIDTPGIMEEIKKNAFGHAKSRSLASAESVKGARGTQLAKPSANTGGIFRGEHARYVEAIRAAIDGALLLIKIREGIASE